MKKTFTMFLIIVLAFSLVACSSKEEPTNESNDNIIEENGDNDIIDKVEEDDTEEKNQVVEPTPKTDSEEVILYFANNEYINTGDESLEKLIPEKRIVEYGDISLEEVIVKELMKGPKKDNLSTVIPTSIKLLGVEVSNGTAFVNFSQEGLFGGSMEEYFTVNQIVGSLLELNNIDRVQFLIDGEKAESLMGHFDISEPFESIQD
ncbi:MAG: GerMN domain-containing protein [Tissierellia bacterium]|nr:GerMN domain-containing protein [Tissierellia bacterium]